MGIFVRKTKNTASALEIAERSRDYFEIGFDDLKKDLKKHFLFGAYYNDEMVGFITYKENNKNTIEISWLAVTPDKRGKGIGSKLVNESLKMLGGKYATCEVKTLAETNPDLGYAKTRNFYKKLNFISHEIISSYPGWGENNPCQIFIKPLKKF